MVGGGARRDDQEGQDSKKKFESLAVTTDHTVVNKLNHEMETTGAIEAIYCRLEDGAKRRRGEGERKKTE